MNNYQHDTGDYFWSEQTVVRFRLTNREIQVLGLLMKGYNNRQIADSLGLKFYTVSSHLKNIYKKLGVRKRANAVFKVLSGNFLMNNPTSDTDRFSLPTAKAFSMT